jgi:hypothetical protein
MPHIAAFGGIAEERKQRGAGQLAEPEVMTDMGFSYGDTLRYQIGGKLYDFTLVASHAYQPGGGSITF